MRIVHITSAHPALDIRIFYKECMALKQAGHRVHLVTCKSDHSIVNGIEIHALNSNQKLSRFSRLYKIYQLAKSISADVYHFHDPEFILFALLLKKNNVKVIYDVHEDTPQESLSFNKKSPLKARFKYLRWLGLEKLCKLYLDGFVCATPHIANNFPPKRTVTVRNYVNLEEFSYPPIPFEKRPNVALYVGGIMRIRGINEMLSAIHAVPSLYDPQLKLIGQFSPPDLLHEVQKCLPWGRCHYLGWLQREALLPNFYSAKVGLVLLHPEPNFKDALPIKLFEYMAASLPVIVSDFPLWRDIVLNADCGFVVDPFDISAIAEKVQFIFDNPDKAEQMGRAGRRAVENLYNWQSQAEGLVQFYKQNFYNKCYD